MSRPGDSGCACRDGRDPRFLRQQKVTWLQATFVAGDTYALAPDTTKAESFQVWVEAPLATYVACSNDGSIAGTYFLKANQGVGLALIRQ